jgi:hypothetical protein
MASLRRHEGYFMLDHRNAPSLTDAATVAAGLPVGAGRGLFEAPTYTCSHCQVVVFLNPNRTRERAYCKRCDHLICDECGAKRAMGAECKTMKQILDEAQEAAEKGLVLPTL